LPGLVIWRCWRTTALRTRCRPDRISDRSTRPAAHRYPLKRCPTTASSTIRVHSSASTSKATPPVDQPVPRELSLLAGRSAVFGVLPPHARHSLLRTGRRLTAAAGTVVVREGDPGDSYLLIASGLVDIWTGRPGTKDQVPQVSEPWLPNTRTQTL